MTRTDLPVVQLLERLDLALYESRDGRLLGDAPDWLTELAPEASKGSLEFDDDALPILGDFLGQARRFWQDGARGRLRSGPFVETDARGRGHALEATALRIDGRSLLLIERLGEDYELAVANLQTARENLLVQEELERIVARRTADLREREEELVYRLIRAANLRDNETGAHIRRIGLYSAALARALGWPAATVDDIRLASPMHDLGKVGIPDRILLKPGRLSEDEMAVMRGHTSLGAGILEDSRVPAVRMAAQIAAGHHEWWNGEGYPRGLAAEDIPECARIVAIVDVYDAMCHARSYKPAFPEDRVLDYLRERRARQFDPRLLDVFFERLPEMRRIRELHPDEGMDTAG